MFLAWLDIPPARRWLDVGCGTGALCAAILEHAAPASVVGVEPSEGFLRAAHERLGARALLLQGSATQIPIEDAAVDAVVSGLMLNFVDDPRAALVEMARVVEDNGTIAAYVWDYAGGMEMMRHFWDAAAEVDPAARALDEGARFPLCTPDALRDLFETTSLAGVDTVALEVPTVFASFDDYWSPFLGGQGPAPAYVTSLDDDRRGALRTRLRARLPIADDGSIALTARAWAVRGSVAR